MLDALGDDDLNAVSSSAHLAHVHALRVRGAAGFLLNGSQCGGGFSGSNLISRPIALRHQEFICIRYLFEHLDAHVVDHLNDVFDLIRIRDILREVIVDFSVGRVTLFFSLCNQGFKSVADTWVGHTVPAVVWHKNGRRV